VDITSFAHSSRHLEQDWVSLSIRNSSNVYHGLSIDSGYGLSARSSSQYLDSSHNGKDGDDVLKGDRSQTALYGLGGTDLIMGAIQQNNVVLMMATIELWADRSKTCSTAEQGEIVSPTPEIAFNLPTLSGAFANGTLTYSLIDASRDESFTPDPTDRRQVGIQVWYPSQPVSDSSSPSYVNDAIRRLFIDTNLPKDIVTALETIPTYAVPAAPFAENTDKHPVLLFSPGLGVPPQAYLTFTEQLASQGYVVVGLTHTDPVEFVQDASNSQLRDAALQQRVTDTQFVLHQLEYLNQADPNGVLTGRLDLEQVGILGHSFGGATAAEAMRIDSRFDAGINLDGTFSGDVVNQGLDRPFMLVNAQSTAVLDPTQEQVFAKLRDAAFQVTLKGAGHYNFSDLAFLTSLFPDSGLTEQINPVIPIPSEPNLVQIDARVAIDITNDYLLAFFDTYLKFQPDSLLNNAPSNSMVLFQLRN
jgi:dienelactone hydrolase